MPFNGRLFSILPTYLTDINKYKPFLNLVGILIVQEADTCYGK